MLCRPGPATFAMRNFCRIVLLATGTIASLYCIYNACNCLAAGLAESAKLAVRKPIEPIVDEHHCTPENCLLAKNWKKHYDMISYPIGKMATTWGSYRPDIYFGMKTRSVPNPMSTGVAWKCGQHSMRHKTEQDELKQFHWIRNDGHSNGIEKLRDPVCNMDISASFIAHEYVPNSWRIENFIQTIKIEPVMNPTAQRNEIYLYFGVECYNHSEKDKCLNGDKLRDVTFKRNHEHAYTISGYSNKMEAFDFSIRLESQTYTDYFGMKMVDETVNFSSLATLTAWGSSVDDTLSGFAKLQSSREALQNQRTTRRAPAASDMFTSEGLLNNEIPSDSQFLVVQLSWKDIRSSYIGMSVSLTEHTVGSIPIFMRTSGPLAVPDPSEFFDSKFDAVFGLEKKMKESSEVVDITDSGELVNVTYNSPMFNADEVEIAKIALSSLLGGLGSYYGTPVIGDSSEAVVDNDKAEALANDTAVSNKTPPDAIELFTATPSRTQFPRGFLWDEGFHQLQIVHWDVKITMSVVLSWINSMYFYDGQNRNRICSGNMSALDTCAGGWIPREMILGEPAKTRVPGEFLTQRVDIANPPTMLLVVDKLIDKYYEMQDSWDEKTQEHYKRYMIELYPSLHEWVTWYLRSQRGKTRSGSTGTGTSDLGESLYDVESFRWRGRSAQDGKVIPNTLASGLDDYPRGTIPSDEEKHVDLHAWMIKSCLIMTKLEDFIEKCQTNESKTHRYQDLQEDNPNLWKLLEYSPYQQLAQALTTSMNKIHWSHEHQAYLDYGLSSPQDTFELQVYMRCGSAPPGPGPGAPQSTIDIPVSVELVNNGSKFCPESHPNPMYPLGDGNGGYMLRERYVAPENITYDHVPRIGYVTIFPLLLQLVAADSAKLAALLDIVENPLHLWSPHGLRSLAVTDMYYKRRNAPGDTPYWRGPIWININYLALGALKHYSTLAGPQQQRAAGLYHALRENVQRTVLGNMKTTGFLWEQYDDHTGAGMKGHPFSGWTALITNIMAEKY